MMSAPATLSRVNGRRATKTVLVVEDDPWLSELLVLLLQDEGYAAVPATDGQSAVKLAARLRPDAITLDLGLPLVDGQGVLDGLARRAATRAIPVVVLSSDVSALRPTRQVRQVLVKPHGVELLAAAVGDLLA